MFLLPRDNRHDHRKEAIFSMVGISSQVQTQQKVMDPFLETSLVYWRLLGIVDYLDQNSAVSYCLPCSLTLPNHGKQTSAGLVEINGNGNAVMRVETTSVVSGNRQSVRITTQSQFNGALFIMDSVHMPTGCGIWPWVLPSVFSAFVISWSLLLLGHSGLMVSCHCNMEWFDSIICLRSELAHRRGNWHHWRRQWLHQQPSNYPHKYWM